MSWVKIFQVIVLSTVSMALMLCLLLFCLWKKNQRLEYKYMKLVASASSKVRTVQISSRKKKDGWHVLDRLVFIISVHKQSLDNLDVWEAKSHRDLFISIFSWPLKMMFYYPTYDVMDGYSSSCLLSRMVWWNSLQLNLALLMTVKKRKSSLPRMPLVEFLANWSTTRLQ